MIPAAVCKRSGCVEEPNEVGLQVLLVPEVLIAWRSAHGETHAGFWTLEICEFDVQVAHDHPFDNTLIAPGEAS